ncbi:MAG TPA: motility protein A [Jatrophihabitans sp.]|jgi:chemotaxis protein MotA|uniref:motility protein A n=1 Tax=Jatrophihabitans sp. TaxID=1932789 RepID=UPI002DFB91BA|nr:motility protein A [Jatrophihabitans sp.]
MDPATIIGVGAALVAIFGSVVMEGGDPMAIFIPAPMVLVFVGTFGAACAGAMFDDVKALPKQLIRAFTAKPSTPGDSVDVIVALAGRARREGLLSLEGEIAAVENPFLKRALEMAVDGTDADELGEILGAEIDAKRAGDGAAAKLFHDMGGFSPTIGIIGTVLGLVHVLGDLSDPSTLGSKIASAFVATLWGVLSANVFFFPLANRLKRVGEAECEEMELALEGVIAIQAGSNPRLIAQKLQSMLPNFVPPEKDAA